MQAFDDHTSLTRHPLLTLRIARAMSRTGVTSSCRSEHTALGCQFTPAPASPICSRRLITTANTCLQSSRPLYTTHTALKSTHPCLRSSQRLHTSLTALEKQLSPRALTEACSPCKTTRLAAGDERDLLHGVMARGEGGADSMANLHTHQMPAEEGLGELSPGHLSAY